MEACQAVALPGRRISCCDMRTCGQGVPLCTEMGWGGHGMPCALLRRAQMSARTWPPCARTTGRAAKWFICRFSHRRDTATFKRDLLGRKQLPIQLNNAPRDSVKIKPRSEEAGSHRHQVLLQHGCAQPRFVYVVTYVTRPSQNVTRPSQNDTRQAVWFAASPSCRNSFTTSQWDTCPQGLVLAEHCCREPEGISPSLSQGIGDGN